MTIVGNHGNALFIYNFVKVYDFSSGTRELHEGRFTPGPEVFQVTKEAAFVELFGFFGKN